MTLPLLLEWGSQLERGARSWGWKTEARMGQAGSCLKASRGCRLTPGS